MSLNCKKPEDVLKILKDEEINFVDLRFTDPRGKWQHLTMTSEFIDDDSFNDGIMFDGSSIAGWKAIHESDMSLVPDPATAVMDPFAARMIASTCLSAQSRRSCRRPIRGASATARYLSPRWRTPSAYAPGNEGKRRFSAKSEPLFVHRHKF